MSDTLNIVPVHDRRTGRSWDCVEYARVADVPAEAWAARWPHFGPAEVRCRGTGQIRVAVALLDMLERLRERLGGKPIVTNSVYRSASYNRRVGGARNSRHLISIAADVAVGNFAPHRLERAARAEGATGIGRYPRRHFIHIDLGRERTWGDPWPPAAADGAKDFGPIAPVKPLARSRTVLGGAVAAATAAASPVVERLAQVAPAAEAAVREHQRELELLGVPVEWIGVGLAVLGVVGAGLAIWARIDDRRQGRN